MPLDDLFNVQSRLYQVLLKHCTTSTSVSVFERKQKDEMEFKFRELGLGYAKDGWRPVLKKKNSSGGASVFECGGRFCETESGLRRSENTVPVERIETSHWVTALVAEPAGVRGFLKEPIRKRQRRI